MIELIITSMFVGGLLTTICLVSILYIIENDNVNNNKKLNKNEVTKNQEWIKKN